MQISVESRQSTWLREKGGGGYGNLGAGTALETEGNFLKYSCERCIQMAFSQWRVAVVVMLSLRKQPFYWGKGGDPHISIAGFFAGTSAKYFSFTGDHFHLTMKGVIKNIPSYTGGGCPIQQNFFQVNNQSADVKGTKGSTIKSWGGGGW